MAAAAASARLRERPRDEACSKDSPSEDSEPLHAVLVLAMVGLGVNSGPTWKGVSKCGLPPLVRLLPDMAQSIG